MLKLKRLQQQKQQDEQSKTAQASGTPSSTSAPATTTATNAESPAASSNDTQGQGTGYVLKRSNSKELLEKRKGRSKENVFTLSKGKRGGRGGKTPAAELRAHKDVAEMEEIPGVEVEFPDPNKVMHFNAKITPNEGLYKGATFLFSIEISTNYPYEAPKAECKTLIYHPNIDWEGHVCLNILRADWKPILTLSSVLFGLVTLFLEPNPDDPLNKEAASLMIDRPKDFERNVQQSLRGGNVLGRQFTKLIS